MKTKQILFGSLLVLTAFACSKKKTQHTQTAVAEANQRLSLGNGYADKLPAIVPLTRDPYIIGDRIELVKSTYKDADGSFVERYQPQFNFVPTNTLTLRIYYSSKAQVGHDAVDETAKTQLILSAQEFIRRLYISTEPTDFEDADFFGFLGWVVELIDEKDNPTFLTTFLTDEHPHAITNKIQHWLNLQHKNHSGYLSMIVAFKAQTRDAGDEVDICYETDDNGGTDPNHITGVTKTGKNNIFIRKRTIALGRSLQTVVHELGHAFSLKHSTKRTDIMYPHLSGDRILFLKENLIKVRQHIIAESSPSVLLNAEKTQRLNPLLIKISHEKELAQIGIESPFDTHELSGDIVLSNSNWKPIRGFMGVLDGKGYAIKNLIINTNALVSVDNVGLFSELTQGATVKNVNLVFSSVVGTGENTGVLAGYAENAIIEKVGIKNAHVDGKENTGALIGLALKTSIKNSYSETGHIYGTKQVGGLVGLAQDAQIQDVYVSAGLVAGGASVGGVLGYAIERTMLENAYASNIFQGSLLRYAGGIVGYASGIYPIRNTYYVNKPQVSQFLNNNGTQINISQMTQNDFIGFDFSSTWKWQGVGKFPILNF